MARPVFFRINEAAVQSFTMPGGDVSDLLWDIAKTARRVAKLEVNSRTGKLRRSIGANRPRPEGPYQAVSLVYANARHALWVHEGTRPIISHPTAMIVPTYRQDQSGTELVASGRRDLVFLADKVRGQRANPYLSRGLTTALAAHRIT